jgi:hypothetical protein
MDEDIEPGLEAIGTTDTADVEEEAGALPYAAVRSAMTARKEAAKARQAYYDDLTAKLTAQRTGPSFSERMFQLSAALAKPTSRRGFGAVLENVAPVLQAQEQAKREGEIKRRDALSALAAAQLAQREGLAEQVVDTEIELAKLTRPKPARAVGNTIIAGVPSVIMQDADGNITTKPLVGEDVSGATPVAERPKTETRGDVEGYYDESGVWKPLPYRPKPKPTQISATSDGQPVFMTDAGPVDAFGNPVTSFDAKPRTLSGGEQKILIQSEDVLNSATDTLGKLRQVMELNPKALEGSLTGFRKQVGTLLSTDYPAYVATEELDNTLKGMALAMLKSTFPGAVTNAEREALEALQGSSSFSRPVRERIYRNAFAAAQTVAARARDRIEKTKSGYYTERTSPTKPAAGKPRVINWNK